MTLQIWRPVREFENIRRDLDSLWEDFLPIHAGRHLRPCHGEPASNDYNTVPAADAAADVIDKKDEILVSIEMPGLDSAKIDVSFNKDVLTVKGESRIDKKDKEEEKYFHRERTHRSFERSFRIPVKVKGDKITAALKDGILTVHLPKADEIKTRKIEVTAN